MLVADLVFMGMFKMFFYFSYLLSYIRGRRHKISAPRRFASPSPARRLGVRRVFRSSLEILGQLVPVILVGTLRVPTKKEVCSLMFMSGLHSAKAEVRAAPGSVDATVGTGIRAATAVVQIGHRNEVPSGQ